jgi:nitrogen-specific signal transduction histidine kinase
MIGPLLDLRRAVWVPLEHRGRLRGILLAGRRSKHGKLPMESLESAASELALAIELQEEQQSGRDSRVVCFWTCLKALIAAGVADYVPHSEACMNDALDLMEHRLARRQRIAESVPVKAAERWSKDFAEVLRHELNNPLTGILGSAELLLAEIARKKDGKLPHGGLERVETIAALAMGMRETVRQLSHEWEARNDPVRQT